MVYTASIIVPVFNTEHYLRGCLQSLLDQTYKEFEIVVVDDCSPGECEAIVNEFQRVRPDIKYVRHSENLGLLLSRFTGAQHSSGDYVGFLDSDDKATPTFVEMLITKANQTAADIIGSLNGISKAKNQVEFKLEGAKKLFEAYATKKVQNYNVWTKLYKRSLFLGLTDLLEAATKKRMDAPEDLLINMFCAVRNPIYVNVPHVLVEYNADRDGSLTNVKGEESIVSDLSGRLAAYKLIRSTVGEFAPIVEDIILLSSAYTWRRRMLNLSDEDIETTITYLTENGGPIFLEQMLRAAVSELKRQKLKIEKLNRENLQLRTIKGGVKTILGRLGSPVNPRFVKSLKRPTIS